MVKTVRCVLFVISLYSVQTFSESWDKWIVITTIHYPTPAVEKFANLPGWRLVVVADKKTPTDWHLDNCDFLSVEAQQKLPYSIIKLLPWNHYSRKNIGYLYAIEHGAQIIYETDDDTPLLYDTIVYLPEYTETLQYQTKAWVINPYAYFGQPGVWPRGYPLSKIVTPDPYQITLQHTTISIQQGLANRDPDVDAIFRLTHAQETVFDSRKEPISLPMHTMCPFNSQNTLFYRSAFWALLMPITPSFRVCDIWRSYWMQRLLWDTRAALCFLPPTSVQYRNAHNLLDDFADELEMYLKTEKFIATLMNWDSQEKDFANRMKNLMRLLVDKEFFKKEENMLVAAWLDDLKSIGYTMPVIS
jgi:hypothetical protein